MQSSNKSETEMDRKRKLSSHRDIHEHLICAICTDIFDDPRNLVCGHVFCKKCLEVLDGTSQEIFISCPTCRRKTRLRERRVDGLSRNIPLSSLLDQDLNEEPGPSCKRVKGSRLCTMHDSELKEIYCSTCKAYICFTCFKEVHSGHTTQTRNAFLKELRQKLDDIKQRYEVKRGTLEDRLHTADKVKQAYLNAQANAKHEIEDKFQRELALINQQKESSIKRLDQHKQKWETDYGNMRKEGVRVQEKLATAVPELMLKSENSLEDLENEDLKSYSTKVDTVMNLLQTDINLEPLKNLTKELKSPAVNITPSTGASTSMTGHFKGERIAVPMYVHQIPNLKNATAPLVRSIPLFTPSQPSKPSPNTPKF